MKISNQEYRDSLIHRLNHKDRKENDQLTLWDLTTYLQVSHELALEKMYRKFGPRAPFMLHIHEQDRPTITFPTVLFKNREEVLYMWARLGNIHPSRLRRFRL